LFRFIGAPNPWVAAATGEGASALVHKAIATLA
jgi:hypothetical protein